MSVDGGTLDEGAFKYVGGKLTVDAVPDEFEFGAVVDIQPETNTSLEGLYRSRTMYCTQCEARAIERSLSVLIARTFYQPTP